MIVKNDSNTSFEVAVKYIFHYAEICCHYSQHWVNAKNYAIRNGIDKVVAKSAALYVIANADSLGVKVKYVPHGPRLRPAPYFAGTFAVCDNKSCE